MNIRGIYLGSRAGFAALLALVVMWPVAVPAGARADGPISTEGSGAGQTKSSRGLAVDNETGTLYVVDTKNQRVDVFGSDGSFSMAFGAGVADGVSSSPQTCTSTCFKGVAGSNAGQFSNPSWIAVDNDPLSSSFHDVYVADEGNLRIQKFSPSGEFILMFGGQVNKTKVAESAPAAQQDVCTAASGDQCGIGLSGNSSGEFSAKAQIPVVIGPNGTVYVGDGKFKGLNDLEGFESRVQLFEPGGAFITEYLLGDGKMAELAVDTSGSFYVKTEGEGSGLRKYDAGGAELPVGLSGTNVGSLAIDPANNDLYVGEEDQGFGVVAVYESDGTPIGRFGYGVLEHVPEGLVVRHTAEGDVYASDGEIVRSVSQPAGPLIAPPSCIPSEIGNNGAILKAKVNSEGLPTTVEFEYVDDAAFGSGGFENPATVHVSAEETVSGGYRLKEASAPIGGLTPETVYHCRAVADNADGEYVGNASQFTTAPPFEVEGVWASEVTVSAARLNASVLPLGIHATGEFEVVSASQYASSGFAEALVVPAGEQLDFGESSTAAAERSLELEGLLPFTRYYYRLRVFDSFLPQGEPGSTLSFRTASASPAPPDGRGYELVSPPEKNGGDVGVPTTSGGLFESGEERSRITTAAPSGEAVTFTSFTAFGSDVKGAPSVSQYLSRRGPGGWLTANINLFGVLTNPLRPPYQGFTEDLEFAAAVTDEPPATSEALSGVQNLYLRNNADGSVKALTTQVPQVATGERFCVAFAGATPAGSHVIFAANGAFAGAPKGKGFSLYEWSREEGLRLVSRLPGGVPAAPSDNAFGAKGGGCKGTGKFVRHAISEDGSRLFWTYAPRATKEEKEEGKTPPTWLLARIGATETVQLDALQGGAKGPAGGGAFWTASPDGSRVVFTDANPLTPDANGGSPPGTGDLYKYDFNRPPGERLEDLTPQGSTVGEEAARVLGVVATSEDGTTIYFAANGVLAPGAEPGNCSGEGIQSAQGSCSLYGWRAEGGIRFIARISGRDFNNWSPAPTSHSGSASPDGGSLAFESTESLTGFDNRVQSGSSCQLTEEEQFEGSPQCKEVYLYDWASNSLVCASCNPSNARPLGPSLLPGWSNPFTQPHYLASDGGRVFFESFDALAPADGNGRSDAYEFERNGHGTCSSSSPSYTEEADGCVFLVSSGTSDGPSHLIDASASGRDVFFSTRDRLVGWDRDDHYDIYDYRIGGGFPEPVEASPCQEEACLGAAQGGPPEATPATAGSEAEPKSKLRHHKNHGHKKKHRRHGGGKR